MKVFSLFSWYPTAKSPLGGSFCVDQLEALSSLCPQDDFFISTHGYREYLLSLREPSRLLANLKNWSLDSITKRFSDSPFHFLHPNLVWLHSPVLEWSPRFLEGNATLIVEAHKKHFKQVTQRFGKPDLLHAHISYPAGWIALHLSRYFQVPYLISEHMSPFPFQNEMFIQNGRLTSLIRDPICHADGLVAVSPALADTFEMWNLPRPDVLPNVVDERRFVIAQHQNQNFLNKPFLLGCLGMLTHQKGIDDLLRALAGLGEQKKLFRLKIAGSGDSEREYKKLASDLGLDGIVTWLGPLKREAVPGFMQSLDAFVLTSRHETMGVVFAEAMACGKPVLATRCGGPEFFVNDRNGILVPIGNIPAISQGLLDLKKNSLNYDADLIRADFMQLFSRVQFVQKQQNIYSKVLNNFYQK